MYVMFYINFVKSLTEVSTIMYTIVATKIAVHGPGTNYDVTDLFDPISGLI